MPGPIDDVMERLLGISGCPSAAEREMTTCRFPNSKLTSLNKISSVDYIVEEPRCVWNDLTLQSTFLFSRKKNEKCIDVFFFFFKYDELYYKDFKLAIYRQEPRW
jgi:hypothetical protein